MTEWKYATEGLRIENRLKSGVRIESQAAPATNQTAAELTKILEFPVSANPFRAESPGFMSNSGSFIQCRHQENQLHPNPPAAFHKSPVHAAFSDSGKMDQDRATNPGRLFLMPENQQSNSEGGRKPWKIPNPKINTMGLKTRFRKSGNGLRCSKWTDPGYCLLPSESYLTTPEASSSEKLSNC